MVCIQVSFEKHILESTRATMTVRNDNVYQCKLIILSCTEGQFNSE